jgi:hypothetical protein
MTRAGLAILLLLLISTAKVCGQGFVQTIRGTITDQDSKIPLIGATITVLGTDPIIGVATDVNGRFEIKNIPVGHADLLIRYLGYSPQKMPQVTVTTGKEVVLNIGLIENTNKVDEVVIKAKRDPASSANEMSVVSTRSFNMEQSERVAASINDPARLAMSFAGVTNQDDVTNDIVVRGNAPKGVLWRVEGMEIPNPNHFRIEGLSAGYVSILSSTVLDRSDFSTGAFTSEYGNALSAVYDLNLRNGNDSQREYRIQAGMLGLQAAFEGPFKKGKRASYLINYRYSTLALFDALGANIQGDLKTGFQDLNLTLNFPTKKLGTFRVFGIAGLSQAKKDAVEDTNEWNRNLWWDQDRVQEVYRNQYLVSGVKHEYIINNRNRITTTLGFTHYGNHLDHSYLLDTLAYYEYWDFKLNNSSIKANVQINTKLSPKHHLRYGVNYSHLMFRLKDQDLYDEETFEAFGEADYWQTYIQHRFRIREDLTLLSGLHINYFGINSNYAIEPRFALKWRINGTHNLTLATGLHSRYENLAFYLVQDETQTESVNKNVNFSRAVHVVLAYDYRILPQLGLKAEAYYQYLYEVPIKESGSYSSLNDDFAYQRKPLSNDGFGMNYGLEITLEKYFERQYHLLLTSSLYQAKYQAADGLWRNTRYNGNFALALTGGKDFVFGKNRNNSIGLNARIIWAGGRRITPIDLEASIAEGEKIEFEDQEFEGRADNYFRIDGKVNFRQSRKKFSWEVAIEVQNTTNRKNELKRKYDSSKEEIVKRYQQGIIPLLLLRIDI